MWYRVTCSICSLSVYKKCAEDLFSFTFEVKEWIIENFSNLEKLNTEVDMIKGRINRTIEETSKIKEHKQKMAL